MLVVIPARGGSKGIPKKNITPVAGKPLIMYTTQLLNELDWVDAAVVSTDSEEIAAVATAGHTAEVVWRPTELAGDRVGDIPVLAHALADLESREGQQFDVVVMLQPTSPLRNADDVLRCTTLLIAGAWDAVWSVSKTNLAYHPKKQVQISENGALDFFIESGASIVARQELEPAFHRNGVSYAFTSDFVRTGDSVFSPGRSTAIVTSGRHISIDTYADVAAVEEILSRK